MSETTIQQSILNKNRKDKFVLVLTLPPILKRANRTQLSERASSLFDLDTIQYSIFGNVVPASTVAAVPVPYAGQVPKVTSYSRPDAGEGTVNFTVDNLFNNYWVLWYWLNVLNDTKEGTYNYGGLVNPDKKYNNLEYQTTLTVFGLDEYNKPKIQWNYDHAFITGVGKIDYNYRDPEEIESSFTFAFGQVNSQLID